MAQSLEAEVSIANLRARRLNDAGIRRRLD
jgi:hypothetical protein